MNSVFSTVLPLLEYSCIHNRPEDISLEGAQLRRGLALGIPLMQKRALALSGEEKRKEMWSEKGERM